MQKRKGGWNLSPLHSARLQGESPAAPQCAPCAARCAPRPAPPTTRLTLSSALSNKALSVQGSRHMSAFLDAEVGVPLRRLHAHRLLLSLKPLQRLLFGKRERERESAHGKVRGVELYRQTASFGYRLKEQLLRSSG